MKRQRYFAEMNAENIIFSVVQSDEKPVGDHIVDAPGLDILGTRWTGSAFVDRNAPIDISPAGDKSVVKVKAPVVPKRKKKAVVVE